MAAAKRTYAICLVLTAIGVSIAAPPAGAKARGFEFGVTAGEVTESSAILWAKAKRSGAARFQITERGGFGPCDADDGLRVEAKKSNDNTIQRKVEDLDPDTDYRFRACMAGRRHSAVGTFTTAPDPRSKKTIRFAFTGDHDALPAPGQPNPYWNNFEVWRRILAQRNDFNVFVGDTMYSDTEVPGYDFTDVALTVKEKWEKYRLNLGEPIGTPPSSVGPIWAKARGSAGYYSHWDDHEFINDFSPLESEFPEQGGIVTADGRALYERSVRAFRDYNPITYTKRDGIYRTFRWGKNLELFFLDQISFRSASADYRGNCDNPPGSGRPDVAPTAPEDKRQLFSLVAPQLANPPPPGCLETINDPDRTVLGRRQFNRFVKAVKRSDATFKVIVNEKPIQQFYTLPYDRWEAYAAERQRLLQALSGKVENTVFLASDHHATFVNDARFQTLESGGPIDSGLLEVATGPVATKPFAQQINDTVGTPDGGALVHDLFFKPQPPDGVGMACASMDQFSYVEATATRSELTLELLDLNDDPVLDTGDRNRPGPPCASVVIPKR